MNVVNATKAIQKRGCLLVFPLANKKEPASIWSEFYPRSLMRWEWDSGADNRVPKLWHLREQLSRSGKVVYAKWFQNRATFFSRPLYTAFLAVLCPRPTTAGLSPHARVILRMLEEDSPISSKILKKQAREETRGSDSDHEKAIKELWSRFLIVGFGEVDDGAFPSLAIGATERLFDDLWSEAHRMDPIEADRSILEALGEDSPFFKYYKKSLTKIGSPKKAPTGVIRYSDLA